jgi:ABC-2 type transport system ATP-binding protein
VADYFIVLASGEVLLAGDVDDLLAGHRVLTGPAAEADQIARQLSAVQVRRAAAQAHVLVRTSGPAEPVPPGWEAHPVGLEELILAYLRAPGGTAQPDPPSAAPRPEPTEVAR